MATALKTIKNDLKPTILPLKSSFKHHSSPFIESLQIEVRLPDEVTKIHFTISHYLSSHSIGLEYGFTKAPKKKTPKKEHYSLSNLTDSTVLPGIDGTHLAKIKSLQKFEAKENVILSLSPLDEQIDAYINLIKANWPSLTQYATEFAKVQL